MIGRLTKLRNVVQDYPLHSNAPFLIGWLDQDVVGHLLPRERILATGHGGTFASGRRSTLVPGQVLLEPAILGELPGRNQRHWHRDIPTIKPWHIKVWQALAFFLHPWFVLVPPLAEVNQKAEAGGAG